MRLGNQILRPDREIGFRLLLDRDARDGQNESKHLRQNAYEPSLSALRMQVAARAIPEGSL